MIKKVLYSPSPRLLLEEEVSVLSNRGEVFCRGSQVLSHSRVAVLAPVLRQT